MPLSNSDIALIDGIVEHLGAARRILFVTGAGISAESGLPTYRGIGGLYNSGKTPEGLTIEEALAGDTMELNPAITWRYLRAIEEACQGAAPNRAHQIIAAMQNIFDRVTILTQNIDGLHHAAGSKAVIDIHGSLHDMECTICDYEMPVPDYTSFQSFPPACPVCGGTLRPAVVLFGEYLPYDRVDMLIGEWERGFDIVFSIGTTSSFQYIAQPVIHAKELGITTVEINPGDTWVSDVVDYKIAAGATETLEAIWSRLGR